MNAAEAVLERVSFHDSDEMAEIMATILAMLATEDSVLEIVEFED